MTTIETCENSEAASSERASIDTFPRSAGYPLGDPRDWTDDELVVAAQNGMSSALDELLRRHRGLLQGAVRRLTVSADDAEDVVQEAMLRAFLNIGRFRREARFSSWLVKIGINSALSSKRKSKRARWISLDDAEEPFGRNQLQQLRDVRPNPEQEYLDQELHDLVRREIRRLPPSYRSALQVYGMRDFSTRASADELAITNAALKSRLWRSRRMLSNALGWQARTRMPLCRPTARAGA